jgi:hypothetical protein
MYGGQYTDENESEYGNILRFANTCGFGTTTNVEQYFKIWNIWEPGSGEGSNHISLIPSVDNTMDLG